ncbi:MAG: hypothetical protein GPOALKHO_001072 [Sodalis sp.]|nr:MAG: hypothetical protein GPOALKHO_001072 [Sodalis sp.]
MIPDRVLTGTTKASGLFVASPAPHRQHHPTVLSGQPVPLVPLTDWHHCFSGDTLITATGPSINEMDFAGLPSMTVVGVNGAYALKDRLDFQLYVIVDMSFIDRRTDVVRAIIADPTLTLSRWRQCAADWRC